MQTHQLRRQHKLKKSRRIGRGGRRGTTSGRGTKGQKARAGHRIRPAVRDIIMQMPKLRGINFHSLKRKPAVFNLDILSESFISGATVSPKTLSEAKLLKLIGGRVPKVKILGSGKLTKKLNFENCGFSDSARKKIGEAGGSIKEDKAK